MGNDPATFYHAGYAAFDRGEFAEAIALATRCLSLAAPESYWHFGALGLRCWAANGLDDRAQVKRDAGALLSAETGTDKPWFDGLALLNLALIERRGGLGEQARITFDRAAERYAAHQIAPEQPPEWALVSRYFAALSRWASCGETGDLQLLQEMLAGWSPPTEDTRQLAAAVDLALRHADGEDVKKPAGLATLEGISRAFLALLLY